MKKTLLVIGGLSLLGYGLYRYLKQQAFLLSKYTWKVSRIDNVKFNINELSMDITFLFSSTADIEAKINRLYLDIFLNDKNVGYVTETKVFIIPARGQSLVPIRISVNPKSVLQNIIGFGLGVAKDKDIKFKFDGFADIKSGFVKTTLPIKYESTIKEYLASK